MTSYSGVSSIPEALTKAPGPSPWYLRGRTLSSSGGELRWEKGDQADGGATELRNSAGAVLARCGFYCHVLPLEETSFLVWTLEKTGARQDIHFQVIDADRLGPLEPALVPPSSIQIAVSGREETRVTALLPEGHHTVVLPPRLRSLPELLMWVQSDDSTDSPLKLWAVDPKTSRVRVFRQTWFDASTYDVGYQWPTRVSRDPTSGHVIGEGIRMGVFSLDASCSRIEEWLVQDSFYGPRG